MRGTNGARLTTGVACLALALSACSSGGGGGSARSSTLAAVSATSGGTATVKGAEPQNPLYPADTVDPGGTAIIQRLFRGLVRYDAKGKAVDEVAESIRTDDHRTWTITLQEGWKFTDGELVTAKSFVDAWNYGALSTNAQSSATSFEPIEGYRDVHPAAPGAAPKAKTMSGLRVVNDLRFTVTLRRPLEDFPQRLGQVAFYPLPKEAFKDKRAYGEHPIGNGPYLLDGEWQHDRRIKLRRNPDFRGPDKAEHDVLVITL